MTEAWPGIEKTEVFALLQRCMTERIPLQQEIEFRFSPHETGWFDVKCQPVPEGIFIQHKDITQRKRAQKELRRSEARFKRALEKIPDVVVIYDTDLRIQYINAATRNITGRPESDFIGKREEEIWPPETYQVYLPMLEEVLETGKTMSLETELTLTDQPSAFLRITCIPLADEEGKTVEVIGVTHDLTKEKKAAAELLKQNRFIESILNFTPDILYIYDLTECRNIYSNRGIQTVLGYTVDEVQSMGAELLPSLMHPDDFRTYLETTYPFYEKTADNKPITHQYRFRHKNGTWRWLNFTEFIYSRQPDGSPRQIFGVAHDITEKLSMEKQLLQAQKMEAIGLLAGGIAHDFNNLLSIILGYGENIVESLQDGDPLREDAREIVQAGQRSAALTRQLLAFSRKQTLQLELLDLNDLVRNLDKMLRRLIGEDIDLVLKLSDEPAMVKVDPGQMEQVIMNLAVNSRDAMPRGGRLILETSSAELDESFANGYQSVNPGNYILLTVTDTGCGMDKKTLARVFDPFFSTKGMGRGTGLGLATVYGIVKQSGGNIWSYSEPGKGTAFKIYLPFATDVAEAGATDGRKGREILGGDSILMVEDDASLRALFERMLTKIGYKVTCAANGEEALRLVEEKGIRPDIVVTDVIMPGMSGAELVAHLTKSLPNLQYLYMSGYTDDSIAHHGVLDQGIPFIQKPFNAKDMSSKIQEVLTGVKN